MKYKILLASSLAFLAVPALSTAALPRLTSGQNVTTTTKATVTTRRFSVNYPDHWMVTQINSDYVMIYNRPPLDVTTTDETSPYEIKTDITIQPNSLREAILGFGSEPNDIQRIEIVTVNGRPGLRIWQESEGWAFSNSLATYIPVNDQEIASIVSFYERENQAAEETIIQMHNTLRLF
ncbi:PsbP-related protein [Nodosilinea sp. P-1105]|uniref:PsbP-related protein n=1 Tax=Nodosilinea sp. P-1105 TaxID=2546229 RepID=UPI00146DC40C|nr:PsbP-related protein [Nodosilinea sp. P-1105]NMF84675.1 hypothetical protein [Nodosilinea sp. P-1105]